MDILEQIGITKEELIQRIVDKALVITAVATQTGEDTWEDIPFSRTVDTLIARKIGDLVEKMNPLIQTRIETIMNEKIEAVFVAPFQRTTKFGDKIGEPTTIKECIAEEAVKFWTEQVNPINGERHTGYGDRVSRAEYYARKVMKEHYNKELISEVKAMAEEFKARIPKTVAEEISKTVLAHLR